MASKDIREDSHVPCPTLNLNEAFLGRFLDVYNSKSLAMHTRW